MDEFIEVLSDEEAVEKVLKMLEQIEGNDLNKFFLKINTLCLAALRGINGVEYVDGLLTCALNDPNKLVAVPPKSDSEVH